MGNTDTVNWCDYGHHYFNKLLLNIVFRETKSHLEAKVTPVGGT